MEATFFDYSLSYLRAGTVISETWEDGQAIKDLNSHLVSFCSTIDLFISNFQYTLLAIVFNCKS